MSNRTELEKYSKRASLKEIISIANQLKTLETDMKDTDKAIAGFCKELNIDTPF